MDFDDLSARCFIHVLKKDKRILFMSITHNLVSRLAVVHQVGQQDGVFGAREAAGSDLPRAFLDGDSLVVLVHSLQEGHDWLIH